MAQEQNQPVEFEERLATITKRDVARLIVAEAQYGSSWKKRGGVGAFMMLARKWDRIEQAMVKDAPAQKYDIFQRAQQDNRAEGLIDDIRDLRRYLLLVEDELIEKYGFKVVDEVRK